MGTEEGFFWFFGTGTRRESPATGLHPLEGTAAPAGGVILAKKYFFLIYTIYMYKIYIKYIYIKFIKYLII